MIRVYLAGVPSFYEGEDIEIKYSIFEDETLLVKECNFVRYRTPATVGAVALLRLLRALSSYKDKEITVVLNEAALCEFIRGTSDTKNQEVKKLVKEVKTEMAKFNHITLEDVGGNHKALLKWNEVLNG